MLFLLFCPGEEGGDDLEDLEFLGIGAVEGEESQEVVGDDLTAGCVSVGFWGRGGWKGRGGLTGQHYLLAWLF